MTATGDPLQHPAFERPNSWKRTGGAKLPGPPKKKRVVVARCPVMVRKTMPCQKEEGHLGQHRHTIKDGNTTTIWAREGTAIWRVGTFEERGMF